MFLGLGPVELVIIVVVLVLLFGLAKLPVIANALGRTLRQFRRGAAEDDESGQSQ